MTEAMISGCKITVYLRNFQIFVRFLLQNNCASAKNGHLADYQTAFVASRSHSFSSSVR
jgi:hypothetical protein